MRRFLCVLAVMAVGSTAQADYYTDDEAPALSGIELSAGIGVLGHNTTGIGDPLLGYGYDRAPGPVADAKLRLLFGRHRIYRHGLTIRGGWSSGRQFGRDGYGFRWGFGDLAYSFRTVLPCMSDDHRRIYAAGTLGFTGARANAGTGRGEMGDDANVRRTASEQLDHRAFGWVVGGEIEVHLGHFLIGLDVDMRKLYGVETVADRTMLGSAVLRLGMAFDFTDHEY